MKGKIIMLLKLILAVISTYSLIYVTGNMDNKYFTANIVSVIIYTWIFWLINKYFEKNSKYRITTFIISLLLSFLNVIGFQIYTLGTSALDNVYTYVYIIGQCALFYSIINLLVSYFPKIKKGISSIKITIIDKYLFNKRVILKSMILILLAWVPIILAFYPGNYAFDAPGEFLDYFNGNYASGNPPAHGFLLGSLMNLGKTVFGSYNTGIFLFTAVQVLFMSFVMASVVNFLVKHKVPNLLSLITLLIFMFLPTHSVMAVTSTKDVLFSGVTVLFFMEFYQFFVENDGGINYSLIKKIGKYLLMLVLCFFMFGFRHNGIYAFLFMIPFTLIFIRKHWLKITIFTVVSIAMFYGYNKFLDKYAYLYMPDPVNLFEPQYFVPYQQIARMYPHATKEEQRELDKFMFKNDGNIGWLYYTARRCDGIFIYSNNAYLNTHKKRFFELYFKLIREHKIIALDAFLDGTIAYWYSADLLPDQYTHRPYIEFNNNDPFNITNNEIKLDSKTPILYEKYNELIHEGEFQKYPILNILMSTGFVSFIFYVIVIVLIREKRFKELAPIMLFVGNMGICLLAPTCILRYMYYIFIGMPILLTIVFLPKSEVINKKSK